VQADALVKAVRRYRIMAYVTGVVLMVLCFVGIPLQVAAHNTIVVNDVGTTHGILYMIYIVVAYLMTRQIRLKLASPSTLLILLAGTIPVLTFVVERWVTRRYINPALAAAGVTPAAAAVQPAPVQPAPVQPAPGQPAVQPAVQAVRPSAPQRPS
jgi:integral membrane protein